MLQNTDGGKKKHFDRSTATTCRDPEELSRSNFIQIPHLPSVMISADIPLHLRYHRQPSLGN